MEQDKSTKKYVIDFDNPIPRGKEYILNPKRICKKEHIPELANLTEEEKEDIRKRVHEALSEQGREVEPDRMDEGMRESESSSITGGYSNEVRGDSEQTCARCMSKDHQPIDFLVMNKKKIILPDEEGLTPERRRKRKHSWRNC